MSGSDSRILCGPVEGRGAWSDSSMGEWGSRTHRPSHGSGRYGGVGAYEDAGELVQHPVLRRIEALEVLLRAPRHGKFGRAGANRGSFGQLSAFTAAQDSDLTVIVEG
jgi:hypothetical protein